MYIFLQMQTSLQFVLINGTLRLFKANDDCVKLWTPFVLFEHSCYQHRRLALGNVFHHYLHMDVYFLLWPFIFSFDGILALFIKRIMLSFLFLYRLLYVFSAFLFIGSHSVWLSFFLSFFFFLTVPCFVLLVSGFVFISFLSVLFVLVFENIYSTLGFVTCENCYRKHTETARKKVSVL